jgi:hypothetical protein
MTVMIRSPSDGDPRKPDKAVTRNVLPIAVVIQILIADDFP